ncbi:MAG: hypothetical protein A2X86_09810 [Bdellovibrionales bacterium GWA2_49_15]|nr:MAG: hypothetical protein A2X86_09810 [Bdellovibrionales bacterium GWA2_49_15]HAZ13078.1 hypothetical protein [Bdellovibrionales bacterium]
MDIVIGNKPKNEQWKERRRVERVTVYNTIAHLKCGLNEDSPINDLYGVVLDLSSQGCCVIVHSDMVPDANSFCRVTIGTQILIPSQIRWMTQIGKDIFKMGLMYQV